MSCKNNNDKLHQYIKITKHSFLLIFLLWKIKLMINYYQLHEVAKL